MSDSNKPYHVTREEIRALLRAKENPTDANGKGGSVKLTEELKKAYIKNAANICPFCKSPDISGGSVDISGREARQEVSCNECHERWCDVYTLSFVEDLE